MSASVVAGGIKVALLTTLLGLVVAMILQVFYNYLLARIDSIVTDMEDSSISLLDIVVKYSKKYRAHDEKNIAKVGDTVRIAMTRPLSKTKRFRLVEIVEKAVIL